jgi:hypothetical protein
VDDLLDVARDPASGWFGVAIQSWWPLEPGRPSAGRRSVNAATRPLDIDRIAMSGAQMAIVSLVSAAPSVAELGRAAASLARAD